jgi:hypothetical protein
VGVIFLGMAMDVQIQDGCHLWFGFLFKLFGGFSG